jgi:hypothetical protein
VIVQCNVAGVTHSTGYPGNWLDAMSMLGLIGKLPVRLEHDPGNAVDPNAIAVFLPTHPERAGWVPARHAPKIARRLAQGGVDATLHSIGHAPGYPDQVGGQLTVRW